MQSHLGHANKVMLFKKWIGKKQNKTNKQKTKNKRKTTSKFNESQMSNTGTLTCKHHHIRMSQMAFHRSEPHLHW